MRKCRLPGNRGVDGSVIREVLRLLIEEEWSPRQISGYFAKRGVRISHETIYRRIRDDASGELRRHRKIAEALGAEVYFADQYASWQKGSIENANKLIRQYIPKGTDFSELSDEFIKEVQYKINRRPREKLNFSTPKREFFLAIL